MHGEYRRLVPNAKTAVLFIHGICGTPNHFRGLLPLQDLVPENWSVYNLVLPGHCKRVEDFSRSSLQLWQSYARAAFLELSQSHSQVILVAHSMGTLFSIQLALEFPEKVAFLFLLAVPLRVGLKLFGVNKILRYGFEKLDLSKPEHAAMLQVCGITPDKKVWKYIPWLPHLAKLIRQMHSTAKHVCELTVPAVAYQSHRDELVSRRSKKILEQSGTVQVYELQRSTHFYYDEGEIRQVRQTFIDCCRQYIQT